MGFEKEHVDGWFGTVFMFIIFSAVSVFLFAILTFLIIFLFWDWATASKFTLWVSTPIAIVWTARTMQLDRIKSKIESQKTSVMNSFMETVQFNPAKTFKSPTVMIAISEDYSKIILCKSGQQHRVVYPSELIEMVLEVNDSVESKSTSGIGGSLTGAALGGVLTGGTGAIIGAIAGKGGTTTTRSGISSIVIKLVLKNTSDPLFILSFLEGEKTWERTSLVGKMAIDQSNEWWAALSVFKSKAAS